MRSNSDRRDDYEIDILGKLSAVRAAQLEILESGEDGDVIIHTSQPGKHDTEEDTSASCWCRPLRVSAFALKTMNDRELVRFMAVHEATVR